MACTAQRIGRAGAYTAAVALGVAPGRLLVAPTQLECLQRAPIFGALAEDTLQFLLDQMRSVRVAAGDCFFREGDQASSMFVLEDGAAVVVKGWRGEEVELRRLGPGDCFGEMALMDLFPRSASVRALVDCTALEMGPDDLHRLFQRDAEQFALIQMNIGREVCRRLRATDEMLFRAVMAGEAADPKAVFRSH
jgi:CRP/FNR family transcriptional regulator, cyclic AMP receptor protein